MDADRRGIVDVLVFLGPESAYHVVYQFLDYPERAQQSYVFS